MRRLSGTAVAATAAILFTTALLPTCRAVLVVVDDGLRGPFAGEARFAPRDYYAGAAVRPLMRRSDDTCVSGHHPCTEINSTLCCSNERYCMVDPTTFAALCCSIGLTCGSPCSEDQYECTTTVNSVVESTSTVEQASATAAGVSFGSTVTTVATTCCPRKCSATSSFLCPSSLGGGCCGYGQTCTSGNACVWTSEAVSSTSTTAPSTPAVPTGLVSAQPAPCTTGDVACPSGMSGSCCAVGHACTVVSQQVFCATTPTGITVIHTGGGLSSSTKVGLSLGVVVGAGALAGIATWICLRRRQRLRRDSVRNDASLPPAAFAPSEFDSLQLYPVHGGALPPPASSVSTISPTAIRGWRRPFARRRDTGQTNTSSQVSRRAGALGRPTASDSDAASRAAGMGGVASVSRLPGLTHGYSGPDAVAGPFTTHNMDTGMSDAYGSGAGADGIVTAMRGVPTRPQGPQDIVAPVEIDSTRRSDMDDPNIEKMENQSIDGAVQPVQPEYFELQGSNVPQVETEQPIEQLVESPTDVPIPHNSQPTDAEPK